ncbi:MAG: hypothetical protein J5855_07465 [Mailhella sp.]|nr:hypothetical protein [Mailhella sp.]
MVLSFLEKLPVPAGCIGLGFAGLATLFARIHPIFMIIFLVLSLLIQALVLLKLLMIKGILSPHTDDISLSTLSGTSMAMMLSAAPLHTVFHWSCAVCLWVAGLALHCLIVMLFSIKLFGKRTEKHCVRGSWLLVYVGLAAAAISAPAFSLENAGRILLIPSGLAAVLLLPLVYRDDRLLPGSQKPLFCITAAPASIWLAGFLGSVRCPAENLIIILLIFSQLLYIPALIRFIRCCRSPFSPAFAAFTFPFVISAAALGQSAEKLALSERIMPLFWFEMVVALVLCCFTAWKYACFLCSGQKRAGS